MDIPSLGPGFVPPVPQYLDNIRLFTLGLGSWVMIGLHDAIEYPTASTSLLLLIPFAVIFIVRFVKKLRDPDVLDDLRGGIDGY